MALFVTSWNNPFLPNEASSLSGRCRRRWVTLAKISSKHYDNNPSGTNAFPNEGDKAINGRARALRL
jgi:hypothetical protein